MYVCVVACMHITCVIIQIKKTVTCVIIQIKKTIVSINNTRQNEINEREISR